MGHSATDHVKHENSYFSEHATVSVGRKPEGVNCERAEASKLWLKDPVYNILY